MAGKARYKLNKIQAKSREISVYASPRIGRALEDILAKNDLFDGVRIIQVLEAVYAQGKKDGARETFDNLDKSLAASKKSILHRNPGRPQRKGA